MSLAPIVLFVYNRPYHTEQTLKAISENELANESVLFIYADGVKENASTETMDNINKTREVIRKKKWCKEVHIVESKKNKGLANSVIEGVTEIINKFDKIIILEDDLITSRGFLKYMNDALYKFSENKNVLQISGYCFPTPFIIKNNSSFFLPVCISWGWGCWKRSWTDFDRNATGYQQLRSDKVMENKFNLDNAFPYSQMLINQMETKNIDSWAIRFWWYFFQKKGIALFPDKSLVKNIGFDSSGTHTKGKNPYPINDFDPDYFIEKFPSSDKIHEEYFNEVKAYIRISNVTIEPAKQQKIKGIWVRIIGYYRNKILKNA